MIIVLQNDTRAMNYLLSDLDAISLTKSEMYYASYSMTGKNIHLIRCNEAQVPVTFLENNNVTVYNKREHRENCFHKDKMNKLLQKCFVFTARIPKWFAYVRLALGMPIVCKTKMHQAGNGCHLVTTFNELNVLQKEQEYLHYERYIPYQIERRIVYMRGIYVLLERFMDTARTHADRFAKCGFNGYRYRVIGKCNLWNTPNFLQAKRVLKKFKLDYCTLDMGFHRGIWYIIEVNSTLPMPKFSNNDKVKMAKYFKQSVKDII